MTYSTIAPLMTAVGTLCFIIKYYVDKYNMLFNSVLEYESNGMTVNTLTRYTIIGIALFNVSTLATIVRDRVHCSQHWQFPAFRRFLCAACASAKYCCADWVVCCWFAYKFLIEDKEWKLINRIFRLNRADKVNGGAMSLKSPKKDLNTICELIRNAYVHPCESAGLVHEYCAPIRVGEEWTAGVWWSCGYLRPQFPEPIACLPTNHYSLVVTY
eukprot:TRINITY_DN7407_c0_g2_i1.p1 TRINITY_DN7407_c0_g2~~TRINITY_DN7407_c0_g2_i1.p1  ORF type:complete len:214 (+),score=8.99 TRINITY_DN7407_c0_g2_i1:518-1159(+)